MKKLLAILAVLGVATSALAEGSNLTHSGDMRVRWGTTNDADYNKSASDTTHDMDYRLRFGTTFNKGEKFSAHLGLNANAMFGENGAQGHYPSDVADENILFVNEAYMTWMATDSVTFKAGRASLDLADGTLVSSNSYEQLQTAFDSFTLSWDQEWARMALVSARGVDSGNMAADFTGLNFMFKTLPDFLKVVSFTYLMVKSDVTGAIEDANRMGLTVSGDTMGIDYRFTYNNYSGEKNAVDQKSSMMDAEVGYSMPDMMNFRVSGLYHTDTGDDAATADNETYSSFVYDKHNNAGEMDVVTWGNITYMKLGLSLEPMEQLKVGFDYYTFTNTTVASGAKDDVGTEMDITVEKKYDDNFSAKLRLGQFAPGDATAVNGDTRSDAMLYLTMGF